MALSDGENLSRMQEEAIARARDMQRRSKAPPENGSFTGQERTDDAPQIHNSLANKNAFLLPSGIKIDEEKALIALLIFVLYKNGADIKLLLGLGYLLI